jgi:hypothetical protein
MAGRTPALGKYLTLTGIGCEHAIRQPGGENQKKRCGYAQYGHGFFLFFFLKRNIDPHQRRFKRLLFQSKSKETLILIKEGSNDCCSNPSSKN